MPDKGDWYHLVDDRVILRRLAPKATLRCQCCGETYERGSFKCCAPPVGIPSNVWLGRCCNKDAGGCGKCPKHCECVVPVPYQRQKGPLADLAASALAKLMR